MSITALHCKAAETHFAKSALPLSVSQPVQQSPRATHRRVPEQARRVLPTLSIELTSYFTDIRASFRLDAYRQRTSRWLASSPQAASPWNLGAVAPWHRAIHVQQARRLVLRRIGPRSVAA